MTRVVARKLSALILEKSYVDKCHKRTLRLPALGASDLLSLLCETDYLLHASRLKRYIDTQSGLSTAGKAALSYWLHYLSNVLMDLPQGAAAAAVNRFMEMCTSSSTLLDPYRSPLRQLNEIRIPKSASQTARLDGVASKARSTPVPAEVV